MTCSTTFAIGHTEGACEGEVYSACKSLCIEHYESVKLCLPEVPYDPAVLCELYPETNCLAAVPNVVGPIVGASVAVAAVTAAAVSSGSSTGSAGSSGASVASMSAFLWVPIFRILCVFNRTITAFA